MSHRTKTAARLESVWKSIREATAEHERQQHEATIIPTARPRKVRKRATRGKRVPYFDVLRAYAAKIDREACRTEGYRPGDYGEQYIDTGGERRGCKCCRRAFNYTGHAYCPNCLHWAVDPESAAQS